MEPVIVTSRLFTAAPVDDSSDSDSSDSTSDSDDDPPEELPSHKPLPIIAKSNAKPASSSSSSSSDSSDSSDSDSDEEVKIPIAVVKTVPPGQGKTATHQRNARKRKAKEYAALAEASDSAVARILLPSPTVVSTLTIVTKTEAKPPPIRKDPYPYADYGAKQVKVVPSPGPSKPTVYTPVSPTCAPLPSLSPPIAELAVFPSFDFLPPIATSPKVANVSTPASKAKNHATHERQRKSREKKQKLFNKDPNNFLPAPSARTDLPSNLVVTRVDVEEIDWSAGLGEVIQGTSREWTRKEAVVVPIVAPVVAPVFEETAIALNDSEEHLAPEWRGWPAAEEIESRWNELREGRKPELMLGDRIAIHVRSVSIRSAACTDELCRCSKSMLARSLRHSRSNTARSFPSAIHPLRCACDFILHATTSLVRSAMTKQARENSLGVNRDCDLDRRLSTSCTSGMWRYTRASGMA